VSILDAVHRHVPAVMEAQAISEKAAKVGFDWAKPEDVRGKIEEELNEIAEAMLESGAGPATPPRSRDRRPCSSRSSTSRAS
jgi:uncharacterized protein YabN with tetrapyrrole methylase and pyrophosphatase domain